MRKRGEKQPRSFEFLFHDGKTRWVAPADAENKPKFKPFSMEKSKSTDRAFLQGDWKEKAGEPA